jgi:hypothetical protein
MEEDLEESGNGVLGLLSGNLAGRNYKKTTKIIKQDSMCMGVAAEGWGEMGLEVRSPRVAESKG